MTSEKNTYKTLLNKLIGGSITPIEKWELEKASLDDPFLADAIEGYYNNSFKKETLESIVPIPKRKSTIRLGRSLLVAASLVALFVVSFLLIQNQKDNLSKNDVVSMSENNNIESIPIAKNEEVEIELAAEAIEKTKPTSDQNRGVQMQKQMDDSRRAAPIEEKINRTQEIASITDNEDKQTEPIVQLDAIDANPSIQDQKVQREGEGLLIDEVILSPERSPQSALVEDQGQFEMNFKEDDSLIVASTGVESQVVLVQPDITIQLNKARTSHSEPGKLLTETLDEEALKAYYSRVLSDIFKKEKLDCSVATLTEPQSDIGIQLTVSPDGRTSHIEYDPILDEDCQEKIKLILQEAVDNGVFGGEKEVSFRFLLPNF